MQTAWIKLTKRRKSKFQTLLMVFFRYSKWLFVWWFHPLQLKLGPLCLKGSDKSRLCVRNWPVTGLCSHLTTASGLLENCLFPPSSCPRHCAHQRVQHQGWSLPSEAPQRSKVSTCGSAGTRRPWAPDSRSVLGRFIWSSLKSLYSQPRVHYCTNTRDATGLPRPHHSVPACTPPRKGEESVWCVSHPWEGFQQEGKQM